VDAVFVRYTPKLTKIAPTNKDGVMGSPRMKKASMIALMGTKLMNRLAFIGPSVLMPS